MSIFYPVIKEQQSSQGRGGFTALTAIPTVYDCTRAALCDSHLELCFTGVLEGAELVLVTVTPPELMSIKYTDTFHIASCAWYSAAILGPCVARIQQHISHTKTDRKLHITARFSQLYIKETILNPVKFQDIINFFFPLKHLTTTNSTLLNKDRRNSHQFSNQCYQFPLCILYTTFYRTVLNHLQIKTLQYSKNKQCYQNTASHFKPR